MQSAPKLTQIVKSIKLSKDLWKEKIDHSWYLGQKQGQGFAIGDDYDLAKVAVIKEGYNLIAEWDDLVVGTDWISSIIAAKQVYGPWAVDITNYLLQSNYFISEKNSLFSRIVL
ncbi:MAG: hypothetical protein J0M03_02720 [Acidobacteria bacterium]|nr:hypothetical protein [Acidobacteriota bacterium]